MKELSQKVAIISDIHANKYALKAFLDYIEENNIDKVLNLGDFTQKGPNPCEVADTVLSDKRFVNIIGNNERKLLKAFFTKNNIAKNKEHQNWHIELLGEERINKIAKIEPEKITEVEKAKILMLHSRRKNVSDFPLIYSTNTADDFVADYSEYDLNIILFGHTHEPLYFKWNNKIFINPGSLGCSKRARAPFVILEIEDDKIMECTFKSIKYDNTKLIEDYEKFNVPNSELFMKIFHNVNKK